MNLRSKSAFTLIETLMAITVVGVVITAMTGVVLSTLLVTQRNLHSLQALAYAEEGVEVLRFIRDSNWLQNYSWAGSAGGDLWGGSFEPKEGETLVLYLKEVSQPPYWKFSPAESDGVLLSGQEIPFSRRLEFTPVYGAQGEVLEAAAEVTVVVDWTDKGVERSVELSTYLTDWQ